MQWLTDFINKFYQTMIVDDRYMQILWGPWKHPADYGLCYFDGYRYRNHHRYD